MIDSIDQYNPAIVEITTPFTHLNFHMIDLKGWSGQIIKTDVSFFKILLENVMSIQLAHELRNEKKLVKNLTNINIQIGKIVNFGTLLIMMEDIKGGAVYIDQVPNLSQKIVSDFDFSQSRWNKLSYVFIISTKDEKFPLLLRTVVEALLLRDVMENNKFTLINDKAETDDKITGAKHRFRAPEALGFLNQIYNSFRSIGLTIKKREAD